MGVYSRLLSAPFLRVGTKTHHSVTAARAVYGDYSSGYRYDFARSAKGKRKMSVTKKSGAYNVFIENCSNIETVAYSF